MRRPRALHLLRREPGGLTDRPQFRGSPLRFRIEKWLWIGATIAVVALDLFFPAFWQRISILYLAVVSNYALVASFAGCEQAAEAKVQVQEAAGED